ncbi:hypothetical protein AGABI2DRAFT_190725 [Agaricus bisporus var. bisporus H97]|uniref:hypothetical protein n=1 Tax=Agaricus bisporus var. bisporus (strain H97 / ATCC MYA-4626 / FGSC 10389) TaxID=936046 RepID=UPI00029F7E6C|nr:hypothetical protein AGABI2DRAFT_190725 [Agaricus bisporus var. bisporus H97]EKV50402.1 hypothetical protein AGABI2DRAFT_190725 [Agaricus bisporus var. bisporus H97]
MDNGNEVEDMHSSLQAMTDSISSARQTIRALLDSPQNLDMKEGISLLSIKHHTLISYIRSLTLLSSRRMLGHTLSTREQPTAAFSTTDRGVRGSGAGDLVDSMIEGRIVLEKTRALENKLKYQIDKLVKLAREPENANIGINDPLRFRPNPQNLEANDEDDDADAFADDKSDCRQTSDGIYRPPRLAPVPYTDAPKSKSRRERNPVPSALNHLAADPSRPHVETTSGLGGIPQLGSKRAAYLKRVQEYEEENFTRLVMKKSEAKRRLRDEADLALGGDLGGSYNPRGRRQAGGLEDEFGDVLRSVGRKHSEGDGYEELRRKSKKADLLSRSRDVFSKKRDEPSEDNPEEARRMKKRSKFELDAKIARKKTLRKK